MSKYKSTGKPVGRPPSGLPKRVRKNINIERNEVFDENLENACRVVAKYYDIELEQVTYRQTISFAIHYLAYGEMPPK